MNIIGKDKSNFHSHTKRCGHAIGSESEYIQKAIVEGYTQYGISDHVPVYPLFYCDKFMRMNDSSVESYLESIDRYRDIYSGYIRINSGFEAEYDEIFEDYLCSLRDKCDYLILGQHYVFGKNIRVESFYPLYYADKVCKGIESGLFDMVAHPDIFIKFYNDIPIVNRPEYRANAILASHMICKKALEYDIPLEINLGGIPYHYEYRPNAVKRFEIYPWKEFWDIAAKTGNKVIVGIDAHSPEEIHNAEAKLNSIKREIPIDLLNFVPHGYNPVDARRDNIKLQDALDKTRRTRKPVEVMLVRSFFGDGVLDSDRMVNKNKERTRFSKYLRGNVATFDNSGTSTTLEMRKDLSGVVRDAVSDLSGRSVTKGQFVEYLTNYVDSVYSNRRFKEKNKITVGK